MAKTRAKLKVRKGKKRDRAAIAGLISQLIAAHGDRRDPKIAEARLALLLAADYEPWVAVEGDAVVAYALVAENGDHVFVRHFVVDAAARGRGVGRALFRALEEEYGGPPFRLDVMDGRADARAFWESLGFEAKAVNMRREALEES
jgi:GNAT superfamily N-acetyltransferase